MGEISEPVGSTLHRGRYSLGENIPSNLRYIRQVDCCQCLYPNCYLSVSDDLSHNGADRFQPGGKGSQTPKPIITTLVTNWAVKPFTMAFFAGLFMAVVFKDFLSPEIVQEYRAGMILLLII